MSNVRLVQKLLRVRGENVDEVISISSLEVPWEKIPSPGIQSRAHFELDRLMQMASNPVRFEGESNSSLKLIIRELQAYMEQVPESNYEVVRIEKSDEVIIQLRIPKAQNVPTKV